VERDVGGEMGGAYMADYVVVVEWPYPTPHPLPFED